MSKDTKKGGWEPKDDTGTLFYDAPGAPTMSGSLKRGKVAQITAEPATDKNGNEYLKISGGGVSGALYANDKVQNERSPDYTGPIEINREKLRVAAWRKQIQNGDSAGQDFLSLSVSEKRAQAA